MVAGAAADGAGGASGAERRQANSASAVTQARPNRRRMSRDSSRSAGPARTASINGNERGAVAAAERGVALVPTRAVRADLSEQADAHGGGRGDAGRTQSQG